MYTVLLAQAPTSLPCYLRAASYATPPSCQALALSVVHQKLKRHSPLLSPPDVH